MVGIIGRLQGIANSPLCHSVTPNGALQRLQAPLHHHQLSALRSK
ncbi:hypothetical protein ACKFKF_16220 [Phormidesmis sp. 146-12]